MDQNFQTQQRKKPICRNKLHVDVIACLYHPDHLTKPEVQTYQVKYAYYTLKPTDLEDNKYQSNVDAS
jgi:hypothetical protein